MIAAAVLAASTFLSAPASAAPIDSFAAAFGEPGLATLSERGYLVLQGRGPSRRLAAVHWKALEALAAAAPSCRALADAAAGANAKLDPGLAACRALPPDGAMTPRLQALASAVAAENEERWSLTLSSSALTEPAGLPNLFETSWGKELAARRRADRLEEPAPLAKGFFEDLLAGPRPNADAVKHFLTVTAARGASGVDALLAVDAARGAASEELRMTIRRYLQDERRRRGLTIARERLKTLLADKETRRQLDALAALAAVLQSKPDLLNALESAVSAAPAPTGTPRLRSAGIHLQDPTRLGQHELGDTAVVSGAYWVDGLAEDASAEIEETTFLETPRGFSSVETRTVKRRNGGPYVFERTLTLADPRPFAFVARVTAASGTVISERVEAPVAPDFELSLKREAEVLQALQSCDPKSAEAAATALSELLADAAKVKPQYAALLKRVARERETAASDAAALARLEESIAEARADSSPQQCRYDASRVDAAIKQARKLPPGCDRVLPELFNQRALITRRAADQNWFLKASAEARSRRRSCDFEGASKRWSEALAVLEADPAARCGKADEEAKAAEAELPAARRAAAWTETLTKAVDKAETEALPAKKLELLRPALARLDALEDRDCRRDLWKRASRLADKAGEDESGPAEADAARRLPADSTVAGAKDEVARARARLLAKSDAASAPAAATPAPPPEPPAAAPVKLKKKPTPAKRAKPAAKTEAAQ